MPIDEELLLVLLGKEEEAPTARMWRDRLASHSLLAIAGDGTCTAHDLQLDYLRLLGPPSAATARLQQWLARGETLDRLAECGRGEPFEYHVMALWREVERVQGTTVVAGAMARAVDGSQSDVTAARRLHTAGKLLCNICLLYTSPSPRDRTRSRMPSSA